MDLDSLAKKDISIRAELMYQVCRGIRELHSLKIAHRDIKPKNFLVFRKKNIPYEAYNAKITDFGLSREFADTEQR